MKKIYLTDWLGLPTTFYNLKSGVVSLNVNDVIEGDLINFDPEGLSNYLEFGYSVFGQTPILDVKFLLPNEKLTVIGKKLLIEQLEDPIEKELSLNVLDESDVIELIRSKINNWESNIVGEIVVPTSGGFDSRLLNLLVSDKSRIRSFTYGVSDCQSKSSEVTYAHNLATKLGLEWQQIQLGEFHRFMKDWDDMYGISTHAHGMYQLEFYQKVTKLIGKNKNLLSGIIGDAWSGNVKIGEIKTVNDVVKLGYTHGISADKNSLMLKPDYILRDTYFNKNKNKLKDERVRIVESMRMKMILLSYLTEVPKRMGYNVYSPFLDVEVACAMLNLKQSRRVNRVWQSDANLHFEYLHH